MLTVERAPGKVHGMTANSVTSVSLDPLLLLICVDQRAQLLPMVKEKKRFGVSILKENQQAISKYFAQTEEKPGSRSQARHSLSVDADAASRCSKTRWCISRATS